MIARPGPEPGLLAFGTPWDDVLAEMVLADRNFLERLKGMKNTVIKGTAKDQPSYRMIQSVEPETLLKQAADYFRLTEGELTRERGEYRQKRALMELLHRYSGFKQRMIGSGSDVWTRGW